MNFHSLDRQKFLLFTIHISLISYCKYIYRSILLIDYPLLFYGEHKKYFEQDLYFIYKIASRSSSLHQIKSFFLFTAIFPTEGFYLGISRNNYTERKKHYPFIIGMFIYDWNSSEKVSNHRVITDYGNFEIRTKI